MNLKNMIIALIDTGASQGNVGRLTSIGQSTVSKIISGDVSDVSYSKGKNLESLHDHVCIKELSIHTWTSDESLNEA